jgi:hypothetical protein
MQPVGAELERDVEIVLDQDGDAGRLGAAEKRTGPVERKARRGRRQPEAGDVDARRGGRLQPFGEALRRFPVRIERRRTDKVEAGTAGRFVGQRRYSLPW